MTTFILDGIWGWHSRWKTLRLRISAAVGPCHIWRYDNSGRTSLEQAGAALKSDLSSVQGPIHLVGYSMGGLVVREALRRGPELPVSRTVFLHTPHKGSCAAHLFPLPACREMRPGSPFLDRLNRSPWRYPTLVTWCPGDGVVIPGWFANWHKATVSVTSMVPAHAWPVISPAIHDRVVRFLLE